MTVEEYIKSKEKFHLMPFVTIYTAIMELINDGIIEKSTFESGGDSDVAICKLESHGKKCRGLHCQGNCHCNKESVG